MLPILTVIPLIQLILLSFAATNEVKNLNLVVHDADHSDYSRKLRDKMISSGYFVLRAQTDDMSVADEILQKDEADIILDIPPGFEHSLLKDQEATIQLRTNAINGMKGGLAGSYAATVIRDFNRQILPEALRTAAVRVDKMPGFNVTFSNWYNPTLDFKVLMVPGILAGLVTILTTILSGMNVVRERELGTIEQINVTPIKKYQFIIGKLLPFLLIGLFDLALGLVFAKLLFNIPMVGNLWLVFAFCVVNIIAILGVGLFISTTANTQQQAMFVAFFFMMIFLLMGGLFTPLESMPEWARYFAIPNPLAHFVEVMRKVLLKGSGFQDIKYHFITMGILAVIINSLAVMAYRKRG
jgi:ABC-2 type transport system permease protein